ncbi:MAG: NAD(P)H-hydrate dehydratase [Deltaproteobacteria bacterium]
MPARLFNRPAVSHKGTFGRVLVVAGSRSYVGAPCLCAQACLRSGAGLVTLAAPEGVFLALAVRVPEAIHLVLPQTPSGALAGRGRERIMEAARRATCCVIGPGLSQDRATAGLVRELVQELSVPLVIDGDGLNALAVRRASLETLRRKGRTRLLTPHPGEFSRLTGLTAAGLAKARKKVAKDFALHYNVHLILKGHRTVVAAPDGRVYVNTTGNPGMATAGSGDVLAGIAAGFLAQGLDPHEAACAAVYLHGLAGDLAARDKTQPGMIASDLIEYLPDALRRSR